jgi:hypothetical protein
MSNPSDRNRWVAIEHDFCDNPKILKVGAAGGWAHLRAIIYAARHRTDGFVPDEAVWQILHDDPVMDVEANGLAKGDFEASMVQAGLWHRVANGYQIHDYLKHQSNAESIREKRARAGRLGGLAKAKQTQAPPRQNKLEEESEEEVDKELRAVRSESTPDDDIDFGPTNSPRESLIQQAIAEAFP